MVKSIGSEFKLWIQIPVVLISYVTLDEFLNLSVPWFSYQYNEYNSRYTS